MWIRVYTLLEYYTIQKVKKTASSEPSTESNLEF